MHKATGLIPNSAQKKKLILPSKAIKPSQRSSLGPFLSKILGLGYEICTLVLNTGDKCPGHSSNAL